MKEKQWKNILKEGKVLVEEKTDNETLKAEYNNWARDVKRAVGKTIPNNKYYRLMKLLEMDYGDTKEWTEISNRIRKIWSFGFNITQLFTELDELIEKLPKED